MKQLVAALLLTISAIACQETEDRTLEDGPFSVSGRVLRTESGVEPQSVEAPARSTDGEGMPEEAGSVDLEVRNRNAISQDLRPCEVSGTFTIFYTPSTLFDPASIVEDDDFPTNLEGRSIDVEGVIDRDEEADAATQACQLVAQTVTVEEASEESPGSTATAEPSPGLPQQG
jgi:hypothetical protein